MNTNSASDARGKILVVDDEPTILFTLKRILEQAGYEVRTAESGSEGLAAFRQGHWDLVTLDRSMPEMSGEEVAAEMKRIAPTVPIILITGFTTAVVRRELFDMILPKPFRVAELLERFKQILSKRPASMAGSCH
jgi:DNA-binding response OmpR family regulator